MREYGTSLICLDQHISKISDTVKGNSACHIAFQQQLPQDIMDIGDLMQIREKKHFFSQLHVGHAIVKLSERYTLPFLIDVPMANIRKNNITDREIKGRMNTILVERELLEGKDPEFKEQITSKENIIEKPKIEEKDSEIQNFSPMQKALYEFTIDSLNTGNGLDEIEKILEKNPKRNYRISDIVRVINYAFARQLAQKREKTVSEYVETSQPNELTEDQQKFIDFIKLNPSHNLSTVEVYQKIGLSARKGTKIKKELEEMNILSIEEIKYEKGWKKLIRLNHTYLNKNTNPQQTTNN